MINIKHLFLCLSLVLLLNIAEGNIILNNNVKNSFPIYRWSKVDNLQNQTFLLFQNATKLKDYQKEEGAGLACLLVMNQRDRFRVKSIVDKLPNTTQCFFVHVLSDYSKIEKWILGENYYLDTSYVAGIIYAASTSSFFKSSPADPISAQLPSWTENYFIQIYWGRISGYIILFILNIIGTLWGSYRIGMRVNIGEYKINLSSICITLETLSCSIRLTQNIIKFIYYGEPWVDINAYLDNILYYLAFPLTVTSGIFLIFFWIDITSDSLYRGVFLHKFKWPAISLAVVMFIIMICGIINYLVNLTLVMITYLAYINFAILFIISIIYYVACYKVFRWMEDKFKDNKDPEKTIVKVLIIKILVSGTLTIAVVITGLVTLFSSTIIMTFLAQFFFSLFLSVRSILLIDIFKTPKVHKNSSRKDTASMKNLGDTTGDTPSIDNTGDTPSNVE